MNYANIWDSISALEVKPCKHLLMYNQTKLIPPKSMTKQVIERAHFSHAGYLHTLETIRKSYYWHGMGEEVRKITEPCNICFKLQRQPSREPFNFQNLQNLEDDNFANRVPSYLFEMIATDLCTYKNNHFIIVVFPAFFQGD